MHTLKHFVYTIVIFFFSLHFHGKEKQRYSEKNCPRGIVSTYPPFPFQKTPILFENKPIKKPDFKNIVSFVSLGNI